MPKVSDLKVKIFADGADYDRIVALSQNPLIQGFTTNPALMRKAGIRDYEAFARRVIAAVPDRPVSLEVFADDFSTMACQAQTIQSWGPSVNVKIPVCTTAGTFCGPLIRQLSAVGVKVNVTGVMTPDQVERIAECLGSTPSIVSVFAGRIADTGVDPVPIMQRSLDILRPLPNVELIWASPREVLNIFQADAIGVHIITVTADLLAKLHLVGKELDAYSLETVTMFHADAAAAGFSISLDPGLAAA
ncbi:MAG: transaldolase [Alphaproteobacteria bacterium]|nr:transaldolase [Alphaproteobacteria bacterium]